MIKKVAYGIQLSMAFRTHELDFPFGAHREMLVWLIELLDIVRSFDDGAGWRCGNYMTGFD